MFRLAPLVVLLAAQNAQAQQIRSVPHPHKSIGQAVHIANNGDIIEVAPGDYTESLTVTHKTITIRGTGGSAQNRLTANSGEILVHITGGAVTFEGFTLDGNGRRGMYVTGGGQVALQDVVFDTAGIQLPDLSAPDMGTSLLVDGGSHVTLQDVTFERATPVFPGGHVAVDSATLEASHAVFHGATTTYGGSLFLNTPTPRSATPSSWVGWRSTT